MLIGGNNLREASQKGSPFSHKQKQELEKEANNMLGLFFELACYADSIHGFNFIKLQNALKYCIILH